MIPTDEALARKVKAELRKRMRGLRRTVPASACEARSEKIRAALLAHPAVANARTVASFWPMMDRHEVDLRPLDATLRARGVQMAYPSIDPESRTMVFRVAEPHDFAERGLGFEEPPATVPEAASVDVVIVPALAVEPRGFRLGYGAGFYDRALPRFCPPAVSIAVVYDFQLLAEVPVTDGDVPVAWIVTDEQTLAVATAV